MKKYLPYVLVFAAAMLCIVLALRSRKITDDYSRLKGAYEQMRIEYAADAKLKDELIARQNSVISDMDKQITDATTEIGHLTTAIGQRDADLDVLRQSWEGLSEECQDKLHELDVTWSDKFSLAQDIIAEKDKIIADWSVKFAAQVTISDTYKDRVARCEQLLKVSEQVNKELESKFRRAKFSSTAKTVALVALAGAVGYQFIRGK